MSQSLFRHRPFNYQTALWKKYVFALVPLSFRIKKVGEKIIGGNMAGIFFAWHLKLFPDKCPTGTHNWVSPPFYISFFLNFFFLGKRGASSSSSPGYYFLCLPWLNPPCLRPRGKNCYFFSVGIFLGKSRSSLFFPRHSSKFSVAIYCLLVQKKMRGGEYLYLALHDFSNICGKTSFALFSLFLTAPNVPRCLGGKKKRGKEKEKRRELNRICPAGSICCLRSHRHTFFSHTRDFFYERKEREQTRFPLPLASKRSRHFPTLRKKKFKLQFARAVLKLWFWKPGEGSITFMQDGKTVVQLSRNLHSNGPLGSGEVCITI